MFNVVFTTFPRIDSILFPLDLILFPAAFYPISPHFDKTNCDERVSIFHYSRTTISPKLSLRLGRVEDNDDLKDILLYPNLTTFQFEGDFFMASTLQDQNADQKVIIAMEEEQIVGLMYVSKCRRDVTETNSAFDLSAYSQLIQGESLNAIEIHLFYIFPEFLDRSLDFLEAAYSLFPQEYCIVCIPYKTIEHPLLDCFVMLERQEMSFPDDYLLITSKKALFSRLSSISSKHLDISSQFTREDEQRNFLLIKDTLSTKGLYFVIFKQKYPFILVDKIVCLHNAESAIVGYAVVSDVDTSKYELYYDMHEKVQLSLYSQREIGRITHFHVNPAYHSVSFQLIQVCAF